MNKKENSSFIIKEYFKTEDIIERNKKAGIAIGKLICKLATKDSCGRVIYTYLDK